MLELAAGWPALAGSFGLGYLAGSIPFGLLLTRLAGLGDVRNIGSGNIGATNVLRTGRKGLALATLVADALKGTLPVLAGSAIAGTDGAVLAGLGAFLGHLFPVWLGFRGGKGVATYIGVLAAIFWPAVLILAAVWLSMAWFFRYSSLASLTSVVVIPPALIAFGRPAEAALFLLLGLLVWIKHHGNIRRLLAGTESRIGTKKP